jgi:hypothetical protein
MARKIPPDAFDRYLALGPSRSYSALAKTIGVSKQAVVQRATRERWKERALEIERKAREAADRKAVETLESMNARHLKIAQAMQSKALAALQSVVLNSGADAMRGLDMAVKLERLVRGEPSDRTAVAIEELIRKEYSRWMGPPDKESANGGERDE